MSDNIKKGCEGCGRVSCYGDLCTQTNEKWREHLLEANQLIRSAYQIAKRELKEGCDHIAWQAFYDECKEELEREHRILYPDQYCLRCGVGKKDETGILCNVYGTNYKEHLYSNS